MKTIQSIHHHRMYTKLLSPCCSALGRLCVAILLASNATSVGLAGETNSDELSTAQIFKKVQETYDAMTSYSDEGRVVAAVDGDATVTFIFFTTRLTRPDFYLIEWNRTGEPSRSTRDASNQGVWSSGAGNFLQAECGVKLQGSRELALANAAAGSGGATATIPWLFFPQPRDGEEQLDDLALSGERQADGKVGDIGCYVFTRESQGQTNTLWIGKQDFLIHQTRTVISTEAIQAAMAKEPVGPELIPTLHGYTLTETHINIVLNRKFSRTDFIPSFPLFYFSDEEGMNVTAPESGL
ncbi:MAG TPA: hypothetical protein VMB80_11745 [Candidatus Acidoferrum sp.]|nr:hypothetical protein [Candidatus Acidoferrum sp.]